MLRHAWALQRWGAARHGVGAASAAVASSVPRALTVVLLVASCLVVALATGLLSSPLSFAGTLPASAATTSPADQVLTYALGWRGPAEDPSITLANGLKVKSSNYRGVPIDGTTYYYNLAPRPSYDPLARGEVTSRQISVVVIRGDYPNRVTIYTIPTASAPPSRPAASRSAS